MKSEPDVYGIADLQRDGETLWDGVRNYQARNFLRQMQVGDRAFFYHSNTKPPGVAGLMRVTAAQVVDPTQFDANSPYFDPKSTQEEPRWQTVKVAFEETFSELLSLSALRQQFTEEDLLILRRGNRLSVVPIEEPVAEKLIALAGRAG
ncbi:MAG: EVE domain-containing protein [Cyanobacteria bacterium P01_A01_bin.135]